MKLDSLISFSKFFVLILLFCWQCSTCCGQSNDPISYQFTIGPELQIYPTGLLPGLRIERQIGEKTSLNIRLAAQIIDHRDLGVQDDETGNGFGGSIGIRKFFKTYNQGWSLSGRLDIWKNSIDWSNTENGNLITGNTNITVLQPSAILEYAISKKNIVFSPSLGLGYEWNVATDGEPTGQGAILLLGFTLGFSL